MTILEGVYWDLDGTIANTELEAHLPAFNLAFEYFDIKWRWNKSEYIDLLKINGGKNRISYFSKIIGSSLTDELLISIHKKKQSYYLDFLNNNSVKLKTGVFRLISELYKKNIRQFIVTSSSRIQVDTLIKVLFGEFNPFEFIISSDDVKFHKPNPMPYLKAISLSGIKNQNSIVFEDSNAGLKSSIAAKLPTIFIPSNIPTRIEKDINSDCIISSLGDTHTVANVIKGPTLEKNYIDYDFLNNFLMTSYYAKD